MASLEGIYAAVGGVNPFDVGRFVAQCEIELDKVPDIRDALLPIPDEKMDSLAVYMLDALEDGLTLCAAGDWDGSVVAIAKSSDFLDRMLRRTRRLT